MRKVELRMNESKNMKSLKSLLKRMATRNVPPSRLAVLFAL